MKNGISNRIKGGRSAISPIPWQVYLQVDRRMRFSDSQWTHCGGTILNEKTILSAAHCFLCCNDPTSGALIGKYLRSPK